MAAKTYTSKPDGPPPPWGPKPLLTTASSSPSGARHTHRWWVALPGEPPAPPSHPKSVPPAGNTSSEHLHAISPRFLSSWFSWLHAGTAGVTAERSALGSLQTSLSYQPVVRCLPSPHSSQGLQPPLSREPLSPPLPLQLGCCLPALIVGRLSGGLPPCSYYSVSSDLCAFFIYFFRAASFHLYTCSDVRQSCHLLSSGSC